MRAGVVGGLFVWAVVLTIAANLTGCAVPALLGVKSVETAGGTKVNFITGADFTIGANGVDTIHNQRGIEPTSGYQSVKAEKKY